MLEVKGLQKSFHDQQVLKKLDLQVKPGEIFGFIGKNGAGKTTTMKIIAGLLKPDAGEVFLEGIDICRYGKKRKTMLGYMPDFFGVYDNLTVQEYMEFYASIYGYSRNSRGERIKELLDLMNLSGKENQYVDSLSRGMKQRLCLARTIVHNPKLLLLDEPTSGLELRERIQFEQIVKKLSSNGVTIFISSHNLNELSAICTSVGILDQGRIVL
ncbi:MAG: ABC transporter ATP-binding protein, partial [Lachnospiraceae bacterium]|nr:ABC transporter ATP-binding protein [Lachnospiraceae bacterium]